MKKINLINDLTNNSIKGRLLTILTNFNRNERDKLLDKNKLISYSDKMIEDNFIYPDTHKEYLSLSLSLFLIGTKDTSNFFNKLIEV